MVGAVVIAIVLIAVFLGRSPVQTFESVEYGFQFSYPRNLTLQELQPEADDPNELYYGRIGMYPSPYGDDVGGNKFSS